jgi:type IV fimbrial biogenesis protein FimT
MTDKHTHSSPRAIARRTHQPTPSGCGFTLPELLVVLAIVGVILAISIPSITLSITNMHLGSAASSLAGAIQSARYQAISTGCPYNIAITSVTYQLSAEAVTGNPPTCAATFSNVGVPVPYSSSEIVLSTNVTLQFNPSGTVTTVGSTVPTNFALVLSIGGYTAHGAPTKTINVSGVGNVKVQ